MLQRCLFCTFTATSVQKLSEKITKIQPLGVPIQKQPQIYHCIYLCVVCECFDYTSSASSMMYLIENVQLLFFPIISLQNNNLIRHKSYSQGDKKVIYKAKGSNGLNVGQNTFVHTRRFNEFDNKLNTLYRMCTNVFVTTISIMFYSGICWKYIVIYYKVLSVFDIDIYKR